MMWSEGGALSFDEKGVDNSRWNEKVSRNIELLGLLNPNIIVNYPVGGLESSSTKVFNGGSILDLCCADGDKSIAALELGAREVVCCDTSFLALKNIKSKLKNSQKRIPSLWKRDSESPG